MKIQLTEAQEKGLTVFDLILDFLMGAEEVFAAPGLGTVVTGPVEQGTVSAGSVVQVVDRNGDCIWLEVREIIQNRHPVEHSDIRDSEKISLRFAPEEGTVIRPGAVIAGWISCPPYVPGDPDGDGMWDI